MPTTYTSLLGFALPTTGELSGTWGDVVNDYITKYVDAAVAGAQTISGSQTAVTLSTTNGSTLSQAGSGSTGSAQYAIINCTGNPAGMLTVTAPATSKVYLVLNNTSTSQSVKVVATGPTTGVTVATGQCALIAWNGSDFELVATTDVSKLSGILAVANGGTGLSSGTSGGVPYFSGTTTMASSAALAANALVVGGGAGAAPATVTTGTGVVTALGVNTGSAGAFVVNGGALGTPSSGTLTNATGLPLTTGVTGTLPVGNGGTGITSGTSGGVPYYSATNTIASSAALAANSLVVGGGAGLAPSTITTGTGVVTALGVNTGSAGAFVVNGGALGTPSSGTLTNTTGLPISTGVSGLGTNVATALGTNVGTAGAFVVNGGALGTPSSGTLTNVSGLPISTGVSGLGTGVATALAINTGSAGAVVVNGGDLGTPSAGVLTNTTGLPLSTGVTGTLPVGNGGTGITSGTSGGVPYYSATNTIASSAALAANSLVIGGGAGVAPSTTTTGTGVLTALGVNTGTAGAFVVNGGALGTPSSGTLTNATGLPLSTGVTGTLPVGNGGTGITSGTSGGVPYFSGSTTVASSAALTANALVIGGGAGAAPATTTTGTGVLTALGNAANATGGFATINGTATLTNKRIDPRVSSTTSTSSITPDISSFDQYAVTAQAATLTINAPTGTPVDGNRLIFRILDNGSSQTLSWNGTYTAIGVTLPAATTASKMTYVGCIYNAANTRWDVIAVTTQA